MSLRVSKKLVTTVLATLALLVTDLTGYQIDEEILKAVEGIIIAYLAAQGVVDVALVAKDSHPRQIEAQQAEPPVVSSLPPEPPGGPHSSWPTAPSTPSSPSSPPSS